MPKDDIVNPEDGEMDEIERELEEFKRFCLMNKLLENRPKVAVQVNLKITLLEKFTIIYQWQIQGGYSPSSLLVFNTR